MEIIVFIFGIVIGSFLNVCIYRIPKEESIVSMQSHCRDCGTQIKVYDLIPILSYVLLKGKCRNCRVEISYIYPLIELVTGVLFLLIYLTYGFSFLALKYIVLICFLIVISIIDFETNYVYSNTTCLGIILGVIFIVAEAILLKSSFINYLFGGFIGGGLIALIVYTVGGMGEGDIEICALCGIFLGWKYTLIMLFLTFIIGAIISMILIVFKLKNRKDYIPLGPFIFISVIITIFSGLKIWNMYIL